MYNSNKEFAANDDLFRRMCEGAGCEPTPRQASKFQNKYGRAYKYMTGRVLSSSKR